MTDKAYIRTSERNTFKRCRTLWDFTSQNRRNLEAVRMHNALSFGIAIHVGLEHYYDPATWDFPDEVKTGNAIIAFREEMERQQKAELEAKGQIDYEREEEFTDQLELGIGMLNYYGRWAPKWDDEWRPVSVEERMRVPIVHPTTGEQLILPDGTEAWYQIRLDLLVEDNEGDIWFVDHKTAGSLGSLFFLEVDTQMMSYAYVVQEVLGKRVAGVVYNELFKAFPGPPKVLQSGKLSKDKRQHTDLHQYEQEISARGLDTAEYADMLTYLKANPKEYVRRSLVHYSAREIAQQKAYIYHEALEMLSDPFIYPNAHKFNCNGCAFLSACAIRNEGGDFEFLLNDRSMFRERTTTEDDTRNE